MNIAIIGSRGFTNYQILKDFILSKININKVSKIVSGGAKGADTLGEQFAKEHNIETLIFKPDWINLGRIAGMARNKDIIKNSDIVFVFWNGYSKGTKNSLQLAEKFNKIIHLYQYIPEFSI